MLLYDEILQVIAVRLICEGNYERSRCLGFISGLWGSQRFLEQSAPVGSMSQRQARPSAISHSIWGIVLPVILMAALVAQGGEIEGIQRY